MQLVLKNTDSKIRATFTGSDGEAVAPTTPLATIVRDSDGEEIVTAQAATDEGDGVVSYTIPAADLPTVDLLSAIFTDGGTSVIVHVAVVGGFLCSLEQITAALAELGAAAPSALALRTERERAEGFLEDHCHVALRPSYARETLTGDGTAELLLPDPLPSSILSATLDGEDVTADLSLGDGGTVVRQAAFPRGSKLDIGYEHGYQTPLADSDRVTAKLARHYLQANPKNYDERAGRIDTEEASYGFLTQPGVRGAETSIPEVNAFIAHNSFASIG